MSNIGKYSGNTGGSNYPKTGTHSQRVVEIIKYLHEVMPILEKEFDALEELSKEHPNKIFPIKMQALNDIYNAEKPLYEWYVEKAKPQA